MYDIILGAASESVWLKGGAGIEFRREYSMCCMGALNNVALNVFDYEIGEALGAATPAAIAALPGAAGLVSDQHCSTFRSNQVNETLIATHLRIKPLRGAPNAAAAFGADVILTNAIYDQIIAKTIFDLYHESQKGADVSVMVEEAPAGEGGDYFATAGALQYAKNGPPHISAARPLPRPHLYKSGQDAKGTQYAGTGATFLRGTFRFGENHGGITLATVAAIMVYLDGYAVL